MLSRKSNRRCIIMVVFVIAFAIFIMFIELYRVCNYNLIDTERETFKYSIDAIYHNENVNDITNNTINNATVKGYKIVIGHVINPYNCSVDQPSYLYHAQKITFKSMINAKHTALNDNILVKLYSVNYKQDNEIIIKYIENGEFISLPSLNRSLKSEYNKLMQKYVWSNDNIKNFSINKTKSFPFIADIIKSLYNYGDKNIDYMIVTNVDIGVQKDFYQSIYHNLINNRSISSPSMNAYTINRRVIPKIINNVSLTVNDLDIIYKLGKSNRLSKKHPGHDCFVFDRNMFEYIDLGDLFLGYGPWGTALVRQLNRYSKNRGNVLRDKFLTFHVGEDFGGYMQGSTSRNTRKLNDIIAANSVGQRFGHCTWVNCTNPKF